MYGGLKSYLFTSIFPKTHSKQSISSWISCVISTWRFAIWKPQETQPFIYKVESQLRFPLVGISAPLTEIFNVGLTSRFLYQLVSEPRTGSKCRVLPSCTNQTGLEISLPDFLPLTLSVISDTLFSLWWILALDMTFYAAYGRYGFSIVVLYLNAVYQNAKNLSISAVLVLAIWRDTPPHFDIKNAICGYIIEKREWQCNALIVGQVFTPKCVPNSLGVIQEAWMSSYITKCVQNAKNP